MEQPYLHEASVVLSAPVQCWADRTGEVTGGGIAGVYVADERVAAAITHSIVGGVLEHLATDEPGGARASHRFVVRTPELGTDPALVLTLTRSADADGVTETLELASAATVELTVTLVVRVVPDATPMAAIRQGSPSRPAAPEGLGWAWRDADTSAVIEPGTATTSSDAEAITLSWPLTVPPRGRASASWRLVAHDEATPFGATTASLTVPRADDPAEPLTIPPNALHPGHAIHQRTPRYPGGGQDPVLPPRRGRSAPSAPRVARRRDRGSRRR